MLLAVEWDEPEALVAHQLSAIETALGVDALEAPIRGLASTQAVGVGHAEDEGRSFASGEAHGPQKARYLEEQVDLGEVVGERADLEAVEAAGDGGEAVVEVAWIGEVEASEVDHPSRGRYQS